MSNKKLLIFYIILAIGFVIIVAGFVSYSRNPNSNTKPEPRACRDLCGNGKCEEIVCMAVGCPCAESAKTCAEDCGR